MPAIDLAESIPYWDTINSNIFLFSLTIAVVLPFVVILTGYGIHLFGLALAQLVGLFIDPWIVYAMINYLFFPGVWSPQLKHISSASCPEKEHISLSFNKS